jgi:hypothetical protein
VVDGERVEQDRVRPHGLDAEFATDDPKGLGQLCAHVSPAGSRSSEEEREVLGADHGAPGSGDSTDDIARVDPDGDGRLGRVFYRSYRQ